MGVKASKTYASIGVQVDWHSDVETPNTTTARVTEEFMEGDHDIEAGADMNEADVSIGSTR